MMGIAPFQTETSIHQEPRNMRARMRLQQLHFENLPLMQSKRFKLTACELKCVHVYFNDYHRGPQVLTLSAFIMQML